MIRRIEAFEAQFLFSRSSQALRPQGFACPGVSAHDAVALNPDPGVVMEALGPR